ncbi:MAG: FMN-binding negative transcriptional regulator [Gammaproteobacteria bacterium]|nr:FMN-binding negative transcriptional regulator [Gammaproteobacteria bacterium]
MHAPAAFSVTDPDVLADAVAAYPLATLLINGADGPQAAHLPLVAERHDAPGSAIVSLVGHMARANPFWRDAQGAAALAVLHGPDGYISPAWYAAKTEHGRVVPTWNYLKVEARGTLHIEADAAAVAPYVEAPTTLMESRRPDPWALSDAPADYVESMLRGVVGVRLEISHIQGSWKLSQNRDAADRAGAIRGLREAGHTALADLMEQAP